MAGIVDFIKDTQKKFQFLKWVQIIPQESLATKKSALYFVEKNDTEVDAIVIDDLGQKRKLTGLATGTGIQSIQEGDNVSIDNTDPLNPIVSAIGGGGTSSRNIDGGTADSVYLPWQVIDGGNASAIGDNTIIDGGNANG